MGAAAIACNDGPMATGGRIEVAVETVGVVPTGLEGYEVVVTSDMAPATDPRAIGLNDVIFLDDLDAGLYLISLTMETPGCHGPDANDPEGVELAEEGFARVGLVVVCGAIVFASDRDGNRELYRMRPDGNFATRLTFDPPTDFEPSIEPGGDRIVFTSSRGTGSLNLFLLVQGLVEVLADVGDSDRDGAWSPDGSRIAFGTDRDGNHEIYLTNPDGSGLVNLTNDPADDLEPAWSPDGLQIAFRSSRDGNDEIYVMNRDGSEPRRITTSPGGDEHPSWSPDGTQLVFVSDRDGNQEIYRMDADGSNPTRLTFSEGLADRVPVWEPGNRILWTRGPSIWIMNAGGSDAEALSPAGIVDHTPTWTHE